MSENKETKKTLKIGVTGMTCASCSSAVERTLNRTEGVGSAVVSLATNEAAVVSVKLKIQEYLKQVYQDNKQVSFAQIGVSILSADEVDDYSNLMINGAATNIPV